MYKHFVDRAPLAITVFRAKMWQIASTVLSNVVP